MAEEVLVAQEDMARWVADRSKIKYIVAEESANSFATIDFFVDFSPALVHRRQSLGHFFDDDEQYG